MKKCIFLLLFSTILLFGFSQYSVASSFSWSGVAWFFPSVSNTPFYGSLSIGIAPVISADPWSDDVNKQHTLMQGDGPGVSPTQFYFILRKPKTIAGAKYFNFQQKTSTLHGNGNDVNDQISFYTKMTTISPLMVQKNNLLYFTVKLSDFKGNVGNSQILKKMMAQGVGYVRIVIQTGNSSIYGILTNGMEGSTGFPYIATAYTKSNISKT